MHTCDSTAGYRIYIVSPWIQAYERKFSEEIGGIGRIFAQELLHRGGLLPFNLQLDTIPVMADVEAGSSG